MKITSACMCSLLLNHTFRGFMKDQLKMYCISCVTRRVGVVTLLTTIVFTNVLFLYMFSCRYVLVRSSSRLCSLNVFKNNSSLIIIAMQRSFHSQIEIPQNDHVSALTPNYVFLFSVCLLYYTSFEL